MASHKILGILAKEVNIYLNDGGNEMYMPSYKWITLRELHAKTNGYKLETIRDAAWQLCNVGEAKIQDNKNDIYAISVGIVDGAGTTALKEKKYLRSFLKSSNVIIGAIIGISGTITALVVSLIKLLHICP